MKILNNEKLSFESIILAVFFAIAPIYQIAKVLSGFTINFLLQIFLCVILFFKILISYKEFKFNKSLFLYIIILLSWYLLTILWSINVDISILQFIDLFINYFFVFLVCSKKWNNKEKKLFYFFIIIPAIYYSYILVILSKTMLRAHFMDENTGAFANQNSLSIALCVPAILLLYLFFEIKNNFTKLICLLGFLIIFSGMIATGSRGGLLSLIVSAIYLFYKKSSYSKNFWKILIIIILFIFAFYLCFFGGFFKNDYVISRFTENYNNVTGRDVIVKNYISHFFDKPFNCICGYGLGTDLFYYKNYINNYSAIATHNDYISYAISSGLIGLSFLLLFYFYLWKFNSSILGNSLFILLLVMSCSTNMMMNYITWCIIIYKYIDIESILYTEK